MVRLSWTGSGLAVLVSLLSALSPTSVQAQNPAPGNLPNTLSSSSSSGQIPPPPPHATAAELEQRGDELRAHKLYREAEEYYSEGIKRSREKRAELYNKIGLVQIQEGRYSDAKRSFERSIKADKTRPEVHNNLGVVHYIQKRYGRAVKEYRKALALDDSSASFHNNLATAYFSQKQFQKAAAEYQRALELDPGIFERTSRMGVAAQMSSPEDRGAYDYVIARMYAKRGDNDQALQYLRKAMEEGYKQISKVYEEDEFKELRKDRRFAELMAEKPVAITN